MTRTATKDVTPHRKFPAVWGAGTGIIVAVIYLPVTFRSRLAANVPLPTAGPDYYEYHPVQMPASYWWAWIIALSVVVIPGLIGLVVPKSRWFSIGYLAFAGSLVALETAGVTGLEFSGGIISGH